MTEELPDYYRFLDVDRHASQSELEQAYLRQLKFYHPDFHMNRPAAAQEMATRRTQALNAAWEVLGDSVKRAKYDLILEDWEREQTAVKAKAFGLLDHLREASAATSPPPPSEDKRTGWQTDIGELLKIDGFEVVDKREQGGALWVTGGPEHKAYFEEWRAKGYQFFHTSGGRSTKDRPAWWLRPSGEQGGRK